MNTCNNPTAMNYYSLITLTCQNQQVQPAPKACYQTQFQPPKKETKQSKSLSEGIKRFLAKKEEEKRCKEEEECKKKENLLALRDQKTLNRINKHLKVCKPANKSVLSDAINNQNTAVTNAGPSQCDEDDYGYVSQETSAFHDKIMNKYNKAPRQKPMFSDNTTNVKANISSTQDKVRKALKQHEINVSVSHTKKRKREESESPKEYGREDPARREESHREKGAQPKKKPVSPPISYKELLKLAEKKQYEPIKIAPQSKSKTGDDQRREIKGNRMIKNPDARRQQQPSADNRKPSNKGIKSLPPIPKKSVDRPTEKGSSVNRLQERNNTKKPPVKITKPAEKNNGNHKSLVPRVSEKDEIAEERRKIEEEKRILDGMRRKILEDAKKIEEEKKKLAACKSKKEESKSSSSILLRVSEIKSKEMVKAPSSFTSSERVTSKQTSLSNVKSITVSRSDHKQRKFASADVKSRQLPASDKKSSKPNLKLKVNKRRICDTDDEEGNSELDGFIDDGPDEGGENYSKHIKEIFVYDKTKYSHLDDEDDAAMESNFAQQLKEECLSTKMGIKEDLEDMRQEALEKKRKAMLKKNRKM